MKSTTAKITTAVALLSGAADAFWRMQCQSRTGLARLDPLVNPGTVSPHSHVIHGGNNFGMDTKTDVLLDSDCTSCRVTQDKSAYWTPALNFIHEDGTMELVPQIGGMLAYYLLFKNEGEKLEAFPPGFQMLAGDTRQRNFSLSFPDIEKSAWGSHPEEVTQKNLGLKALGFNCLNYGQAPEASMYRHFLPDKDYMDANCPDGIRAELFFPSCWNGELDSPNHMDHMAYPSLVNGGTCPEDYDRRVPSLFYETIWNTNKFNGKPGQFVFSNGDPTGYGYHGDFITGWDEEFLQQAVDECTNDSGRIEDCPIFDIQSESDAAKCTFEVPEELKDDDCEGPAPGLCGGVNVQAGPGYATPVGGGDKAPPKPTYTPPPPSELPEMPTLSYQPAKSAVTDEFGGGISVARHGVAAPSPDLDVNAKAEPTSVITSSPPEDQQPPPTPAPAAPEPEGRVISTSTYTSAGVVYEVEIVEVPVYVTADAPAAPAPRKRHLHHMKRKDREHGLLGRRHIH